LFVCVVARLRRHGNLPATEHLQLNVSEQPRVAVVPVHQAVRAPAAAVVADHSHVEVHEDVGVNGGVGLTVAEAATDVNTINMDAHPARIARNPIAESLLKVRSCMKLITGTRRIWNNR